MPRLGAGVVAVGAATTVAPMAAIDKMRHLTGVPLPYNHATPWLLVFNNYDAKKTKARQGCVGWAEISKRRPCTRRRMSSIH